MRAFVIWASHSPFPSGTAVSGRLAPLLFWLGAWSDFRTAALFPVRTHIPRDDPVGRLLRSVWLKPREDGPSRPLRGAAWACCPRGPGRPCRPHRKPGLPALRPAQRGPPWFACCSGWNETFLCSFFPSLRFHLYLIALII